MGCEQTSFEFDMPFDEIVKNHELPEHYYLNDYFKPPKYDSKQDFYFLD